MVADEFKENWNKLPFNQQYVLEAIAKAKINDYDLKNDDLGNELGRLHDGTTIKGNTISQYKSRGLQALRDVKISTQNS